MQRTPHAARGALARLAVAIFPLMLLACGRKDGRALGTADTAAAQSAARNADTAAGMPGMGPGGMGPGAMGPGMGAPGGMMGGPGAEGAVPDSALVVPAVITRADSAAGDSLFHRRARCMTCHGERGQGLAQLGPDLRDSVWLHIDGSVREIARTILTGIAVPKQSPIAMPSFAGQLTPEQAVRVAQYVYTLSHAGAVTDSVATDTAAAPGAGAGGVAPLIDSASNESP